MRCKPLLCINDGSELQPCLICPANFEFMNWLSLRSNAFNAPG
tara:strand:+ start:203 stop:331 length:129 start_codon:yes stop_codon:yes gene_type:complete